MAIKFRVVFLLCIAALLATGCGGVKIAGTTTTPPSAYNFSGDWKAILAPEVNLANVPILAFLGTISASNGDVTGSLIAFPNGACTAPGLTPIPVSGTVDTSGNLTITLPIAGGTATLTAAISTDVETDVAGSFKIVGGSCAMPATAMQIAQYAPLNGTYKGTFNLLDSSGLPTPGSATAITAMLTQSSTPNANDEYAVTGTLSTTGACAANITLANASVLGGGLISDDTTSTYLLIGTSDPTATTLSGLFLVNTSSPGCPFSQALEGTLTRQ